MRIAYVINSVEGGGAAAPVPAVCRVLTENGAEVAIFALMGRDRRALPPIEAAGLEAHVRPNGEDDHHAALRWLQEQVVAWRADVIWTSLTRATLIGQIVGQRLGLPVVSWQHNAWLKPANRLLLRLRQRRSALWIADSECVAALTRRRLRVSDDRLVTWPLFAADEKAPRAAPWRPGETVRVGSLGRLHPAKGYDILVQALARLGAEGFRPPAPFEVLVAGEGAERDRLTSAMAAAGVDTVRLIGFQPDPRAFLAGLHLYAQPSRREGLCIAVHEAMQAGLPTIGSAVGEMPWSIHPPETGRIVQPGDPAGLAAALAECLSAPEKLAEMGRAARDRVLKKFSQARFEATGAEIMHRLATILDDA